jgi:hypothetical protein
MRAGIIMNKKKITALITAAVVLASASPITAATQASSVNTTDVTISNNANIADTIMVTGLNPGDTIKVYRDSFSSTVIGKATVPSGSTFVTVSVPQLGVNKGSIYLSVTNPGKLESTRVAKTYEAEPESIAPLANDITVINGPKSGIVKVINLQPGDTIKVYKDENKTRLLGSAVVAADSGEVSVNTSAFAQTSGDIYISLTSLGKRESTATKVTFTGIAGSTAPLPNEITVVNNGSMPDTVTVDNLEAGDVVNVYRDKTSTRVLGTAIVAAGQTTAAVAITQLGQASGKVYVSVISPGRNESERVEKAYDGEAKTTAPSENAIFVTNNSKAQDTISVENLQPGDVVKVYRDITSTKPIATATVTADKSDVILNVGQLSLIKKEIYITVTSPGKQESDKTTKDYSDEVETDPLSVLDIAVTNNPVIPDTVVVENLQPGETIKVYRVGEVKVLGSATVATGRTTATVSIPQLGKGGGSIDVTVTTPGCSESAPVTVDYIGESSTSAPKDDQITVQNNAYPGDTVTVTGLKEGSIVKLYRFGSTKLLGTATVAAGSSEATVTVQQLGEDITKIDITVTAPGMGESDIVTKVYENEQALKAGKLSDEFITITNNASIADTVLVENLKAGDVIKVYNNDLREKLLGTATVQAGKNSTLVNIPQIGTLDGKVYVTVTSLGTTESDATEKTYGAEATTDNLSVDDITITNNTGASDTVSIDNLNAKDIVKVYSDEKRSKVLGTATVATGKTNALVTIPQIGQEEGMLFVTVTSPGMAESQGIGKWFAAEGRTDTPSVYDITVLNNVGKPDTINVEGLEPGDTVKVYNSLTGGKVLGTSKVATGKNDATVSIAQLGQDQGSIYVSVTSAGRIESDRTEVTFDAEPKSDKPDLRDLSIENNKLSADIVRLQNLTAGDVVKVYRDDKKLKLLGTATVAAGQSDAAVNVSQLGNNVLVYVTVTTLGKSESNVQEVNSGSEDQTIAPYKSDITTFNNSGIADTLKIINLKAGDIVNVYRQSGTRPIGTATVTEGSNETIVYIDQLGLESGKIFVTITSLGKRESEQTEIVFAKEDSTAALSPDNITITNNIGSADEILVENLSEGDIIKVYKSEDASDPLSYATVEQGKTSVLIKIDQLEEKGIEVSSVYLSVTNQGKTESGRKEKIFSSEANTVTVAPAPEDITIVNNGIIADTISVRNLTPGAIVKIYKDITDENGTTRTLIGTSIVPAEKTETTMSIAQVGNNEGTIFVSVQAPSKTESALTSKNYAKELVTEQLSENDISIQNNSSSADIVKIDNLSAGDTVKIYSNAEQTGKLLGVAVVPTGKTGVTINISQLGTKEGNIYVTVTTPGKLESLVTTKGFFGEAQTVAPLSDEITVMNNSGKADTVKVENLTAGDVVKVYDEAEKKVLGSAKVPAGKTNVVINITQLGVDIGTIKVSVTSSGKLESDKISVSFNKEADTDSPSPDDIFITNNGIIADKVRVVNLSEGDIVKVFNAAGTKVLGTATVQKGKTEATVTITQLGTDKGSIQVSVKSVGKIESGKTTKEFDGEASSDKLSASDIFIINNANAPDTVRVVNLTAGDIVKVYREKDNIRALGTAVVAQGKTEATVTIGQLGTTNGTVWISVVKPGKKESTRISKDFLKEDISNQLDSSQIIIIGK